MGLTNTMILDLRKTKQEVDKLLVNISAKHPFSNKVVIHLHMFGVSMKDRIGSNGKCSNIITPEFRRGKTPRSFNTWQSHESSAVVVAKALYSGLVEDLEIVSCFLALQVMGLLPR